MTNERPPSFAWRNALRFPRKALAVLLAVLGAYTARLLWGEFHCTGGFDWSVTRNDYGPFLFTLAVFSVGMGLWFWEESPRPLGVAILMLPLSLVFGSWLGRYRCGLDVGHIHTDAIFVVPSLVCLSMAGLLLAWKRKPIPRPAGGDAITTKVFNRARRIAQFPRVRYVAGAAAVVAMFYFMQPAGTASTSVSSVQPAGTVATRVSQPTQAVPYSSLHSLCTKFAAHPDEQGVPGVSFNTIRVAEALGPCAQAAQSPEATALDAFHYGRVLNASKSYADSAKWYRKAADKGLALAQYSMGYAYANGEGVSKSAPLAAEWYRRAADQNNPDALLELGVIEWNARGRLQNKAQALQHMRKAAALGNAKAKENLPKMEDAMAASNQLDAYAKSLGPFGEFLRAVQKNHEQNGYYDKDANGQSQYDRDAEEVRIDTEAREREQEAQRRQQEQSGEATCQLSGLHYAGVLGCR